MINPESIQNSLQLLKAGIKPHPYHNRSIHGFRKAFYYISLWAWRLAILIGSVLLSIYLITRF